MVTSPDVTAVAMAGHLDSDMVPHFLRHYRGLGVSRFRLILHGPFDAAIRADLSCQPDVEILADIHGLFTERMKVEKIDWCLRSLVGEWAITCDMDELLELPAASMGETIEAMDELGITSLPAFMVQRIAADGLLHDLGPADCIEDAFPLYSFHLAERMGCEFPVIKTKYPLLKVAPDSAARDGFHFPPNRGVPAFHPLRATLSHFKWRRTLLRSVEAFRGEDANSGEMAAFKSYLSLSGGRLPLEGSRRYSRDDLVERGLLIPVQRKARVGPAGLRPVAGASEAEATSADPAAQSRPLRVCLVTRELNASSLVGGIGTATAAMAENLARAGHEVTILYLPYDPRYWLLDFWLRGWAAQGIEVIQTRPEAATDPRMDHAAAMDLVLRHLEQGDYDIAHFDDAHAIGARAFALRASGLGLKNTKMVMTSHGCAHWHSEDGNAPATRGLAHFHEAFRQQLGHADFVIFPSRYMEAYVRDTVGAPARAVVLPNAMSGFARSFSRSPAHRRPDEIVYFGRIEPRKGWDIFLDAMDILAARGLRAPKVTLLGRFGTAEQKDRIAQRLGRLAGEVAIRSNMHNIEAVNYLKAHDCMAVLPSRRDNLPYTVYECLENGIPMICSDVGGNRELVHPDDWERTLVASDAARIADAVETALKDGWTPARLAFGADDVADRQLSLFERIGADDRDEPRQETGPRVAALHLASGQAGDADHPLGIGRGQSLAVGRLEVFDVDERRFDQTIAELNRAIRDAEEPLILLHHASAQILSPELPAAMARLLSNGRFDAAVCDYYPKQVSQDGELLGIGASIPAPGGPPQIAPSWNVFGAGIAMIRRSSFVKAGLIDTDCPGAETLIWEVLNKMAAAGCTITSVPRTLVCRMLPEDGPAETRTDLQLHTRLSRHWIAGLDDMRASIIAAAIHEDFVRCPYTAQLHAACNLEAPH